MGRKRLVSLIYDDCFYSTTHFSASTRILNQIVVDKETEIHVVNLQKFKFKLCRGNKELLLSTLNESEMHEWIKALKQVISGEFHAKLMKDEKHRELREKQRKQDEKRAKEMAEAQRLACLESVSC